MFPPGHSGGLASVEVPIKWSVHKGAPGETGQGTVGEWERMVQWGVRWKTLEEELGGPSG